MNFTETLFSLLSARESSNTIRVLDFRTLVTEKLEFDELEVMKSRSVVGGEELLPQEWFLFIREQRQKVSNLLKVKGEHFEVRFVLKISPTKSTNITVHSTRQLKRVLSKCKKLDTILCYEYKDLSTGEIYKYCK